MKINLNEGGRYFTFICDFKDWHILRLWILGFSICFSLHAFPYPRGRRWLPQLYIDFSTAPLTVLLVRPILFVLKKCGI